MSDQHETAFEKASQFIREAEQRRDEQARIVAGLTGSPEVAFYGKRILREMEYTLQIARMHQTFLLFLYE